MASYVGSTSKSSSGSGRQRHFYDEVQLEPLDAEFTRDSFPNREGCRRIAQLIGVSEKSIMWWFQNRRRRARQLGSSRAATSTRETNRQHRRSSPYVSRQLQQDSSVSPQVLPTSAGFFFDPRGVPSLEQINYSTPESTPSQSPTGLPPQSEWITTHFRKEVLSPPQFNCNYYRWISPGTAATTATRLFPLLLEQLGILSSFLFILICTRSSVCVAWVRNLTIAFLFIRILQLQMLLKTSSGVTAVLTRHFKWSQSNGSVHVLFEWKRRDTVGSHNPSAPKNRQKGLELFIGFRWIVFPLGDMGNWIP